MRLGEMIKEYREARGMSQRAFARKCGLSNGQIAFLERGIGNSGQDSIESAPNHYEPDL